MPSYKLVEAPPERLGCLSRQVGTTLTWYTPRHSGDSEAGEAWCSNNGPSVIEPRPRAKFVAASSDTLTIAIWNLAAGSGWVKEFLKQEVGLTCQGPRSYLADSAHHLIFLTQEALRRSTDMPKDVVDGALLPKVPEEGNPGSRLDIVQVAEQCGLSLFYVPGSRNGPDAIGGLFEDKGNAILSTLPLTDFVAAELPFESVRRAAPIVSVEVPETKRVRVASLHLITTPPPARVLLTGNSARERQALGLIDVLTTLDAARGAESTIVGGDLNTFSHREVALRRLRKYLPDSPPALKEPTRPPLPADHLLFRANAFQSNGADHIIPGSYRRIDDRYYSDHHPIMALLQLNPDVTSGVSGASQ